MPVSDKELLQKARDVMKNAYCSGYRSTKIFPVNCENASYGGGICAERNAMTTALAQRYRKFKAIAVATELNEPGSPCGICRQFLSEFGEFKVSKLGEIISHLRKWKHSRLMPKHS
ncbi:putative cytidine deaminase [Ancylostoma duodenale]|uniref:Putative cytidine deaminase n=1 Tax=Ancylostoma duodenale TaxID=51022 RepID=A0A0C2GRA3_9BILA|nr:putative cytidine deaminase [Ancylostoma duodenale]